MGSVVTVDFSDKRINVKQVAKSRRALRKGSIAPAIEATEVLLAEEHKSDPIKSLDDITAISDYYLSRGKYRDNMLFILGINFGLRVSDLVRLRFSDLIDDNFQFKMTFPILEKKTSKTRKTPKNRYITINDAVMDAVTLYLENTDGVTLSDYLFRSQSNNGSNQNKPMHRNSVESILKRAANDLNLPYHVATHTLRKTFGYHQMVMGGNDPRTLLLLQKIFGHSTAAQTLEYIGITSEEIQQAYLSLNLGGVSYEASLVNCQITG